MAATANQIRQVAIELKDNVETLKTAADTVKTNIDAIHAVTDTWVVNADDLSLPAELDVKAQLTAYEALSVNLSKASNLLSDSIAAVKAAE